MMVPYPFFGLSPETRPRSAGNKALQSARQSVIKRPHVQNASPSGSGFEDKRKHNPSCCFMVQVSRV